MITRTTSSVVDTTRLLSPNPNGVGNNAVKALFANLYDVRFGGLWWAREDFVAERTPHWTRRMDRKGHPALVMVTKTVRSLDDRIPLAIGTSNPRRADFSFVVTADGKRTYFSFNHVAWATPMDFLFRDREAQRSRGEGYPWETNLLWRNADRPSLGLAESFALRDSLAFTFWNLYAA